MRARHGNGRIISNMTPVKRAGRSIRRQIHNPNISRENNRQKIKVIDLKVAVAHSPHTLALPSAPIYQMDQRTNGIAMMARARQINANKQPVAAKSRARTGRGAVTDGIFWEMIAINAHIEEISFGWAKMMGVNVHQWMILMAIQDLDQGLGVSVGGVSAKLHTDPSIVTTQSKGLEKGGWIDRTPSEADARVVLMKLTPQAKEDIARVRTRRDEAKRSIFDALDDSSLNTLHATLVALSERFSREEKRIFAEL
jgi:DNA-binding MarR family transcriptional regulator